MWDNSLQLQGREPSSWNHFLGNEAMTKELGKKHKPQPLEVTSVSCERSPFPFLFLFVFLFLLILLFLLLLLFLSSSSSPSSFFLPLFPFSVPSSPYSSSKPSLSQPRSFTFLLILSLTPLREWINRWMNSSVGFSCLQVKPPHEILLLFVGAMPLACYNI